MNGIKITNRSDSPIKVSQHIDGVAFGDTQVEILEPGMSTEIELPAGSHIKVKNPE